MNYEKGQKPEIGKGLEKGERAGFENTSLAETLTELCNLLSERWGKESKVFLPFLILVNDNAPRRSEREAHAYSWPFTCKWATIR